MANTSSATKAARQAVRRTAINRMRQSRIRTLVGNVEAAIASRDKASAQAAFKAAQPELMRGVSKQAVHKNTVARKLARLSARIKAL